MAADIGRKEMETLMKLPADVRSKHADAYFQRALTAAPDDTSLRQQRGEYYFQKFNWERAAADFEIVVQHNDSDGQSWYQLGWAYFYLDQLDKALQAADKDRRAGRGRWA